MKEYNKLVRDKVPQIIEQDNHVPVTRVLSDGATPHSTRENQLIFFS